jgi:YebC/PmpR family DNA-binding regulatory protein
MGRWMAIKNRKASADARKGVNLARLSREVLRSAQLGGGDPTTNYRLRTAIEKAKIGGLTSVKIEHAIAKGSGTLQAEQLEAITYEGYGPGGVAVFVEATTDNRNRTAGDVRSYFNKSGGSLGQDGSVGFLFEAKGRIWLPQESISYDDLFALAADAGADDVEALPDDEALDDEGNQLAPQWVCLTAPDDVFTVAEALHVAAPKLAFTTVEQVRLPQTTVTITDEALIKPLEKLLFSLDEHDDVNAVYHNAIF